MFNPWSRNLWTPVVSFHADTHESLFVTMHYAFQRRRRSATVFCHACMYVCMYASRPRMFPLRILSAFSRCKKSSALLSRRFASLVSLFACEALCLVCLPQGGNIRALNGALT